MALVKSSTGTRAERARQTRNRMIDSARELFIADGYAATTMERIAQEAGVAVQTLYYTFRSKGQLLCEVVEATAAADEREMRIVQTQDRLANPRLEFEPEQLR